jgi:hypothetical protein
LKVYRIQRNDHLLWELISTFLDARDQRVAQLLELRVVDLADDAQQPEPLVHSGLQDLVGIDQSQQRTNIPVLLNQEV